MASTVIQTESNRSGRVFRFGLFEFRSETGELRKRGIPIKLGGQPVNVVAMLLERPGEVITREDLQERLWPKGTYVDFEHSINAAVKRLRHALSDSADSPRFIETIARTGYRFIAPISLHLDEAAFLTAAVTPILCDGGAGKTEAHRRQFRMLPAAIGSIALAAIIVSGLAALRDRFRSHPNPGPIRSMAVLPLTNVSGDPEQEYLVEGIADALRQDLQTISALRVISRASSMYYRESRKPLPEIARLMNVDAIVEGSVLRAGDRIRINVELVQAGNDSRLWGGSYDRRLEDVLTLQSEVAQRIADGIRVTLTRPERERLTRIHTANPDAYLAYSKGRFFWNKRTDADLKTAIVYFQQAIEKDPKYALAYDGVADCWAPLAWYGYVPPGDALPRMKAAVLRALALDASLAEAHTTLAFVTFYYDRDWANAEREFRRAIDLNATRAQLRFCRTCVRRQKLDLGDLIEGYAATAMPVRYAVERQQWSDAANLVPPTGAPPHVVAVAVWARGLGYARIGRVREARAEAEALRSLEDQLRTAGNEYWATQVKILRQEVIAWISEAAKKPDRALALMRKAANQEDAIEKLPVTPGPVLPAREQLGYLLLQQQQSCRAANEFRTALALAPGRLGAINGALQAGDLCR